MISTFRTPILFAVSGISVGLALVAGCGPKPDASSPQGQGGWGASTQGGWAGQGAQTQGGYAAGPTANTAPTATTTTPPPPASTTAPVATVAPPPPIDPAVLQKLLEPLAKQQAPGAKPEGGPLVGMLEQGKSLEMPVVLAASGTKCYTGIGVGLPPITDLVVELWTNAPPIPPTIVSQSQGGGNQVVMAGKPNCFKNMLPIPGPAIFKVTARGGTGPVLAQLYAK